MMKRINKYLKSFIFYFLLTSLVLPVESFCTSRAIQIDLLLAGITNPTTGDTVASGTVYFYSAGTLTAKNVWTEKEKTNAYSSYSLSGVGTAQLYAEGNYKIVVKDSDGTTVLTLDNIRLEFPYYGIRTITQTDDQETQDDFILVNTTGGVVTINAIAAASWTRPLKIQRISGSNSITLEPNGSETIDGSANLTWNNDAIVEIISDGSNLRSAGYRSSFADADNDTKIQVEEAADEDIIRFDTGGTERVTIQGTKVTSTVPLQFNSHQDADADTKVQVEESADEDKVRIDTGGVERVVVDSNGLDIVSGNLRVASTSVTATASELNTAADGIANPPLAGDSTAGRLIKTVTLWIRDGTNASTLKCKTLNEFNGDVIAEVDNIAIGGTTSGFTLDETTATAPWLQIESTNLTGNCVGVMTASVIYNASGTNVIVAPYTSGNGIKLFFQNPPSSGNIALSTLVDTGDIYLKITYLTDS